MLLGSHTSQSDAPYQTKRPPEGGPSAECLTSQSSNVPRRNSSPTPMEAGSSQIGFIRFFEPLKHLRWGDRPFRQMRVERARADIWRVDQFRSRKFLGLSLVRKCFGHPCVRSRLFGLKRNVPRALGLTSHDETLLRLRRRLAVGDKPKLLGILGNAQRDLRDLNQPRAGFVPRNPILANLPALRIRFPRDPLPGALSSQNAPAASLESWRGGAQGRPIKRDGRPET